MQLEFSACKSDREAHNGFSDLVSWHGRLGVAELRGAFQTRRIIRQKPTPRGVPQNHLWTPLHETHPERRGKKGRIGAGDASEWLRAQRTQTQAPASSRSPRSSLMSLTLTVKSTRRTLFWPRSPSGPLRPRGYGAHLGESNHILWHIAHGKGRADLSGTRRLGLQLPIKLNHNTPRPADSEKRVLV